MDKRRAIDWLALKDKKNYLEVILDIYNNYDYLDKVPSEFPYDRVTSAIRGYLWAYNLKSTIAVEDYLRSLEAEVHNLRSSPIDRAYISELTNTMKKLKVRTIKDFFIKVAMKFDDQVKHLER